MHLVTKLGHKTVFGTQPLQKGGRGTQPDLVWAITTTDLNQQMIARGKAR
jgi:hypothetical protein